MSNEQPATAKLGCWVRLNDPDMGEEVIHLVEDAKAAPKQNKIPAGSPFAQALIGSKPGDVVRFTGTTGDTEELEVLEVGWD